MSLPHESRSNRRSPKLAINGGSPVRSRAWPTWPVYDHETERALIDCVRSRRWAISWPSDGTSTLERRFAEAWAHYNGVPYCVSVDHGSSALVVALEALDIGPGDEVIVPTMTWVAPASAVLRVGAVPILADVDAQTGCLTPETLRASLSNRTRAVITVHLGCAVADIDGILAVTKELGIELIEDCAQAHGARWNGQAVGSFGALGAFSFQNGKVLTGGEGGAVVTSNQNLYDRLQQLRADSRRYPNQPVAIGEEELVKAGRVMGANYCMPEFCAAVLLDQLGRLDMQIAQREKASVELENALAQLGSFSAIPLPAAVTRRSIFRYAIQFAPSTFGTCSIDKVAEALSAELGLRLQPPDAPLHRSLLFRPQTKRRFARIWSDVRFQQSLLGSFSGAEQFARSTLQFHHSALLGESTDVEDIVAAINKVRRYQTELG